MYGVYVAGMRKSLRKWLERIGIISGIWAIIRAIWTVIGHYGNFQTLWGLVKDWPTYLKYAALIVGSQWFPVVLTVLCLVAWWVLKRNDAGVTFDDPRILPPEPPSRRLKIECNQDDFSMNTWGSGPVRFLHAFVSINDGSAPNCKLYLTAIKRDGDVKWSGGPEQLTFSPHPAPDSLCKTLHAGVRYQIDVLVLTPSGEIRICNDEREWRRWPRLRHVFLEHGDYILSLSVVADDIPTLASDLKFSWRGWNTSVLQQAEPTARRLARSPEVTEVINAAAKSPIIPSVRDRFETDFKFGAHLAEREFKTDSGQSLRVSFRVHCDYDSRSKFVSAYVPESDLTFAACEFIPSYLEKLLTERNGLTMVRFNAADTTGESSDDLVFTKKIYVYHETNLTPQQLGSLHDMYETAGLKVHFRGRHYASTKWLQERAG